MSRRTRRTLTAEVNALSPTDRLPAEVLAEIFLAVAQECLNNSNGRQRLQWIAVTHVSRRWRNTALSCGRLWCSIQSGDPAIREWLKRARGTALFVELKIGTTRDESTFNMVIRKLPQIQTLSIEISSSIRSETYDSLWPKIMGALSNPAPMLKSFRLDDRSFEQESPVTLLPDSAPLLRHLRLDGIHPTFPSLLLHNITNLSIHHPQPQLNPASVLVALARMPLLECLTLENAFVATSLNSIPATAPVHLAKLKAFNYRGLNFNLDITFLSHLSLNIDTRIMLLSCHLTADLSLFSRLIEVHNRARDKALDIRTLHLLWGDQALRLVISKQLPQSEAGAEANCTSIKIVCPLLAGPFPTSWGEDLLRLPLSGLQHFSTNCNVGRGAWDVLSKRCTSLSLVSLADSASFSFIACLVDDYKQNCPYVVQVLQKESFHPTKALPDDEIAKGVYHWDKPIFKSLGIIQLSQVNFEEGGQPPLMLHQQNGRSVFHVFHVFRKC
ncbi:hypothetical protein BDN72DRAFT_884120 [Pluteus cervinus]|uniref:Uncharacterized protein n=1 Tax=Pluteus cervinus TaxID=181527 RepID=A0ACD2ZZL6_9AGAR|nr:hypothetical protein BDN72DRAFT_884120 [Pluteus cervinus]